MSTQENNPDASQPSSAPLCSAISDYNPVQCLQEEVRRFKATNRFTPMDVTGFYIQAAVVLDYVRELEESLNRLLKASGNQLHREGGLNELYQAVRYANAMHRWPNEKGQR